MTGDEEVAIFAERTPPPSKKKKKIQDTGHQRQFRMGGARD